MVEDLEKFLEQDLKSIQRTTNTRTLEINDGMVILTKTKEEITKFYPATTPTNITSKEELRQVVQEIKDETMIEEAIIWWRAHGQTVPSPGTPEWDDMMQTHKEHMEQDDD